MSRPRTGEKRRKGEKSREPGTSDIAEILLIELDKRGVEAYIIAAAASGSVYIGFKDPRMGKLRISTHEERSRYGYRWQLRTDVKVSYEDTIKGHKQFFYPADEYMRAIEHMENYYEIIQMLRASADKSGCGSNSTRRKSVHSTKTKSTSQHHKTHRR